MKLKSIMMVAAVSFMLGACASTAKKTETCACGAHSGAAVEKKDCSSGECPMHKPAGCADCQEKETKSGK